MKTSAGILPYRLSDGDIEVFLVHPGGPFWKNKDLGAWSVAKGEFTEEDPLVAAKREFREETGIILEGEFLPLPPVKLKSGKLIYAWSIETDLDAGNIVSNEIELEWPPRSGKSIMVPEVDRAGWFPAGEAREKINAGQVPLLDALLNLTGNNA